MPKILLVEDDATHRDMVTLRLKWEGFSVITANDGAQGVAMARQEQPDLILMDMGLPVLNGWQATHRIKSMPATRAIPVIALTAYAMNEERVKCLGIGCDDYEPKPMDFTRLLGKIRTLLGRNCANSPAL